MQEKDTKQHFITKRKSAGHVIKYCIDNSAKTSQHSTTVLNSWINFSLTQISGRPAVYLDGVKLLPPCCLHGELHNLQVRSLKSS